MDESHTAPFAEWHAPVHWQAVDFISDLHLQSSDTATFDAWLHFLQRPVTQRANALFILGDLFEVWVGDDALHPNGGEPQHTPEDEHPFWRACAAALKAHSQHTPVFFMHGNRDFLLGPHALSACGMQGLSDPTVLVFQAQRWLLSHGDALCLDDTDYMHFRAMVREPAWQRDFLARPLTERETIARNLRQQSLARKAHTAGDPTRWADVDGPAARAWLQRSGCTSLIHGHTHRPACHDLGNGLQRVVLSDWDLNARPPRAEVLRLDAQGLHRLPLAAGG
ncbi:UDP-2,3-diacylglucosamine diphosphatase [Hydrogenophaga sp.]|uniref:UDP-2,3-diacylglucosamine diphosphatase n=1 Tax=Hydrogenophaga sp. TaxID=1904254 RepID=UPI003F6A53F7